MERPSQVVHHPFGLRYLWLKLNITLIRWLQYPHQFLDIRRQLKRIQSTDLDVTRTKIEFPSRERGRNIVGFMYRPRSGELKSRVVHLNFHGSGYVVPSLGVDTEFCALVASKIGCIVIDCDYRKAPEYPFPAAREDAEDAILHFVEHGDQYGIDDDNNNNDAGERPYGVTLSGFSAGGSISLTLSTSSDLVRDKIRAIVGIYPNPDLTGKNTYQAPNPEFQSGHVLSPSTVSKFHQSYLLPTTLVSRSEDPRLSSISAPVDRFPAHLFLACGDGDRFYVPNSTLAKRLREEGHGDVEFMGVEREAHSFDKGYKEGSETERKVREMYEGGIECLRRGHQS